MDNHKKLIGLPFEILMHIFEHLDTSVNFLSLIVCRQLNTVCRAAIEKLPQYKLLLGGVAKIKQELGEKRAQICLFYIRKYEYSRVVLERSLRVAHTIQHVYKEQKVLGFQLESLEAFDSLPIEWILTQPSPSPQNEKCLVKDQSVPRIIGPCISG